MPVWSRSRGRADFVLSAGAEGLCDATSDVNGDGLADVFVDDGPMVFVQRRSPQGTFEPRRVLR